MSRGRAPRKIPAMGGSGTLAAARWGVSRPLFVSRLSRATTGQVDWRNSATPLPSSSPSLRLAIVTCMDARLDIGRHLGITTGDAHILRNAGGRVTPDVIRSLHLSVKLMNVCEIGIVHHTGCGLANTDNDTLARRTGVHSMDFLPIKIPDSLSTDVTEVLQAGVLPTGGIVWGAVYRLDSGQISVTCGPLT
jgi:carbonic anhydrase